MTQPLAKVRNPQGRVDVLLAQVLERGLQQVKNPVVPVVYQHVKPLVEQLLKHHLGPRTRRGRKVKAELLALRSAFENVQRARIGGEN